MKKTLDKSLKWIHLRELIVKPEIILKFTRTMVTSRCVRF